MFSIAIALMFVHTGEQNGFLYLTAKVLSHMYPRLDLKAIANVFDLGDLLHLSRIISSNSRTIEMEQGGHKICDRFSVFQDLAKTVFKDERDVVSREFLFESKCVNAPSILENKSSSYWEILENYHSIERFHKMFDAINRETDTDFVANKMLEIFKNCNNGTLLRAYLSYEQRNYSFNQDKLIKLIALIFKYSLTGLFNEIIVNPSTKPYLEKSPELLLLPEHFLNKDHFPSRSDIMLREFFPARQSSSNYGFDSEFMENYIATEFYRQSDPRQNLISLSLSIGDISLISQVTSLKGLSIRPHQFYDLYRVFSASDHKNKFVFIQTFWDSLAVFSVFSNELSYEERIGILNEIVESRDFYHIFALSQTPHDYYYYYYAVTPGVIIIPSYHPYPNPQDRTECLIDDQFFDSPASRDRNLQINYLSSNNFKLRPELHSFYIFKCLSTKNYEFLQNLFYCEDVLHTEQLSKDQIMEIFYTLINASQSVVNNQNNNNQNGDPLNDVIETFFKNSKIEIFFLSADNEELFIKVLKDLVRFNRIKLIKFIFFRSRYYNYFKSIQSFDIIKFCLRLPDSDSYCDSDADQTVPNAEGLKMLRAIWRHPKFIKGPSALYEKYWDDHTFMELINSDDVHTAAAAAAHFSPSSSSSSDSDLI